MDNLLKKFECPHCNYTGRIELIEVDCVVSSEVQSIIKDDVEYINTEISDGVTDKYCCWQCGWVLDGITNDQELITFLKEL